MAGHRFESVMRGVSVDRARIDSHLNNLLSDSRFTCYSSVLPALRAALAGGNRLRPLLAIYVARLLRAETEASLHAAIAVELVHCASLVIDDLPCMDNSSERRGHPSLHVEFGQATAILAAFGLVNLACRCFGDYSTSCGDPAPVADFRERMLSVLGPESLIEGQLRDLRRQGISSLDQQNSGDVSDLKTVPLFELAIRAGTISACVSEEELLRLLSFGAAFGRAYQLADDYLDHEHADLARFVNEVVNAKAYLAAFGAEADELCDLVDALHRTMAKRVF